MIFCSAAILGLTGCNIDSGDEAVRTVGVDISGLYSNGGGRIISPSNTGAAITSLNVVQSGDRLEAVDNNGQIFRGTIGAVVDSTASFNMTGQTTAGNEGVIAGSFTVSGSSATMSGTWAEPALFGSVAASASVAGVIDSGGGSTGSALAISSSSGSVSADLGLNASRTFTASGGSGTYTWSRSVTTLGSLSPTSGSSTTYTANSTVGNQVISLRDSAGTTTSASFSQN